MKELIEKKSALSGDQELSEAARGLKMVARWEKDAGKYLQGIGFLINGIKKNAGGFGVPKPIVDGLIKDLKLAKEGMESAQMELEGWVENMEME